MEKISEKELKKMQKHAAKPAALFSFDGAIMDTENAIMATYRHVFAVYEKEITTDVTKEEDLVRCDPEDIFKNYLPHVDTQEALHEFNSYEHDHLIDLIRPMHGGKDLLVWLKKNGYQVGIVSARDRNAVVAYLRHTDLDSYIDVILGKSGYGATRTEAILMCCQLMHADSCIFITDSARNLQSGAQAGTFNIGIVTKPERTAALVEAGADFLTRDYKEIRKLMEGEPLWLAYTLQYPEEVLRQRKKAEKKALKERKKKKG